MASAVGLYCSVAGGTDVKRLNPNGGHMLTRNKTPRDRILRILITAKDRETLRKLLLEQQLDTQHTLKPQQQSLASLGLVTIPFQEVNESKTGREQRGMI